MLKYILILKKKSNSLILLLKMMFKNYVVKIKGSSTKFYLPYYRKDYIQRTILQSGNYYEYDNLHYICNEWRDGIIGKTISESYVLDLGSNIGNHSLYFLNECNALGVYCFEPIKDTFRILSKNIQINGLSHRATLYNVGVASSNSSANVQFYTRRNIGATTLELSDKGKIQIVSIDSLGIAKKIGMVKIDVEGFELQALKGMLNLLKRDMPYLTIEIRNENHDEAVRILEEIGYNHVKLDSLADYSDYLFYA